MVDSVPWATGKRLARGVGLMQGVGLVLVHAGPCGGADVQRGWALFWSSSGQGRRSVRAPLRTQPVSVHVAQLGPRASAAEADGGMVQDAWHVDDEPLLTQAPSLVPGPPSQVAGEGPSEETKQRLRDAIAAHLTSIGVDSSAEATLAVEKDTIRAMHAAVRLERLVADGAFIRDHIETLQNALLDGRKLEPAKIEPVLIEVKARTPEAELFRLATKLWSVPVSSGFGRRLRFLVWDRHHNALIGMFAIGDPVFNLSSRDAWISWNAQDRRERLVSVMDAFVMGAVPPYSGLIGGKLVAALAATDSVREAYDRKYGERVSVILQRTQKAPLVLLTTTSALGRSSLYNRLRVPEGPRFERIGATKGYGHFHFSAEVFKMMRQLLAETGHAYAAGNRFGDGPNWRLRVARVALREIGMDEKVVLNHGVAREVYAAPLAANWREVLQGTEQEAQPFVWPTDQVAERCLQRWVVPRATRDESYRAFRPESVCKSLLGELADLDTNGTVVSG